MFLKASSVIAAISLLISFFLYMFARIMGDLMASETYYKFRYLFRFIFYLGDMLTYLPLAIFLFAFFMSQRAAQTPSDQRTMYYGGGQ